MTLVNKETRILPVGKEIVRICRRYYDIPNEEYRLM